MRKYNNLADLKKNCGQVKEEIKGLGNVNVNAIDDYKEISERYTFMNGQRTDLQEAEEALKQVIHELDEGMKRQFKEQFVLIQTEFDKAFKELFGGGKGTLELIDEDDVLETGIRIISQPAWKETAEHDAAVRWREGTDCHCAFVRHPELKAVSFLSSGRDRGSIGRFQR